MRRPLLAIALLALGLVAEPAHAVTLDATAYCLHGRMADGRRVYWGAAASNRHPLGTLIRLRRPALGKRWFPDPRPDRPRRAGRRSRGVAAA